MAEEVPDSENIATISKLNAERCKRWHGEEDWSVSDWALAAGGEAGEVLNAVKKLRRIETGVKQSTGPQTREEAIALISKEIGDTYLYFDLLARKLGLKMSDCIADSFNGVSEREGFPERINKRVGEQFPSSAVLKRVAPTTFVSPSDLCNQAIFHEDDKGADLCGRMRGHTGPCLPCSR